MPGSSKCLDLLLGGVKQATEGHKTRLIPHHPHLPLKTRLFEFHCKSPSIFAVMAINELSRAKKARKSRPINDARDYPCI